MVQIEFILDKIFDWIRSVIFGFGKHLLLIHSTLPHSQMIA